jgi:hypothetical protein
MTRPRPTSRENKNMGVELKHANLEAIGQAQPTYTPQLAYSFDAHVYMIEWPQKIASDVCE